MGQRINRRESIRIAISAGLTVADFSVEAAAVGGQQEGRSIGATIGDGQGELAAAGHIQFQANFLASVESGRPANRGANSSFLRPGTRVLATGEIALRTAGMSY